MQHSTLMRRLQNPNRFESLRVPNVDRRADVDFARGNKAAVGVLTDA